MSELLDLFVISGTKVSFIRGMWFINGVPLIAIIDMGVTHSFISYDCVVKLNLVVSPMKGNMVIDTLTNGFMTTSLVCLNFPVSIYGKDFGVDLIYFPLSKLDFVLGMNWLEFNHVGINFFDKTVLFPNSE